MNASRVALVLALLSALAVRPQAEDDPADPALPDREIVSGKVVLLTDALARRKIKHYTEEHKGEVVLETAQGELLPILSDWRGRAFHQDERLRDRKVDLVVLRSPGVPYLRVQSIYTFDEKDQRQITDYWCDLCAIPMYEIKACECCQGETRLRFRPQELPAELTRKK
jgi:hypothetical protein